MSLRKMILPATVAGLFGVAAWGAWGYWHGGAEKLPLPTQSQGPGPGKTAAAPKSPAAKAPQTPPGRAAVATVPAPPSYLYIKYLPDAPESAGGAADGAVSPGNDLGTPHPFPAARLRVSSKGDRGDDAIAAMLFSDDPKEAMDKNWTGDRYYFSINFQQLPGFKRLEDRLDGAQWVYTASETEHEENGNGIFLHGDQIHLEPISMWVQIEGKAPNLLVKLGGMFLQYDTADPDAKPKRCQVQGILAPRVEIKG